MRVFKRLSPNKKSLFAILFFTIICFGKVVAQCPVNIDFESGSFTNWQCYTGNTTSSGGQNYINVSPSAVVPSQHLIIPKGSLKDPYGGFPISPPDGSKYCIKLGNSGVNAQAERVSYTFNVPANAADFQITYQYAIVLEDPGHPIEAQPRFTAKVLDVASNTYITCGSFNYVATANLPGFKHGSGDVIYKDWTPVTLSLAGYQGKQIKLEFTTADCTAGGHFGYAYIDVQSNCSSLVVGTDYCLGSPAATLNGPAGFAQYKWYNADRSVLIDSTSRSLVISPPPPDSTIYILDVFPYPGFGCTNTIIATVRAKPAIIFNITDPPGSCTQITVDLTAPAITAGNDANLNYSYWRDSVATLSLLSPEAITVSGKYYIQAASPSGCSEIKPVNVFINQQPDFTVTNPALTCLATPVDITLPALAKTKSYPLTYTYWKDAGATKPLTNATNITTAGTYYIKGTSQLGCSIIKPITVSYYPLPVLIITDPAAVCYLNTVDITPAAVTQGSDPNLTLSYWQDAAATTALGNATAVAQSGTYYIKAVNTNGCQMIKPVKVVINPLPVLVITDPPFVCIPEKIDITKAAVTAGSTNVAQLSYWRDALGTIPLSTPTAVADSGVYYIKATTSLGCDTIKPVLVAIHNLPVLILNEPHKIYKPGTTDITTSAITKGSSPELQFTYWKDANATIPLPNSKAINDNGTYYIKGTNKYGCSTVKGMEVIVADIPDIKVPTAFTPLQITNNRLFPFLIAIKTFKMFKVFNKWGNVVYQTTDLTTDKGWDGYFKGGLIFLETYTWVAEGYDYTDNLVYRSGNTLMLK